jgi:hypothetical protein
MKQANARKRRSLDSPFAPAGLCQCCGRFIVLLKTKPYGAYRACYLKGWDGSPWFSGPKHLGGNAVPHPKAKYARFLAPDVEDEKPEVDPFFELP